MQKWARGVAAATACLALVCVCELGLAQMRDVPADIQVELVSKLENYDRTFASRAGAVAHVFIVVRPGNNKSEVAATDVRTALGRVERLGGLPHDETLVPFAGVGALVTRCQKEHAAIVYFTPGFDDDVDALRAAFSTVPVLTVTSVAEYVPRGVVLGFELESGKPKILINLEQARLQGVNFPADVLRLMKVFR